MNVFFFFCGDLGDKHRLPRALDKQSVSGLKRADQRSSLGILHFSCHDKLHQTQKTMRLLVLIDNYSDSLRLTGVEEVDVSSNEWP